MTEKQNPTPTDPEIETESAAAVEEDLANLSEQFQKANDERDQLKDQLLRTMADFQNFRKRVMDEKRLVEERAKERIFLELLPVLDNFERSLAAIEAGANPDSIREGVLAVDRQFRSVLTSQNVTRIEAVGAPFDHDLHDAIATVESDEYPPGTIVDEIEAGYRMGDRVIRHAKVRVSKAK